MTPTVELSATSTAHAEQDIVLGPLDCADIMATLPHRYPFLLVDKVLEVVPGKRIKAIKNVSFNEPFFQGHFPGLPLMPGVLQIEALAQAGAFAVKEFLKEGNKMAVLTGVDNFRFRRMVKPGDQLVLEGEITKLRGQLGKGHFKATVDGEEAASGDILFSFVPRDGAI
jgi:3-hydroxyacyl-[acyl-carrier-protein] dehydratase